MATSKQVGGDGAFIDPDDLERAAKAMKAASVGVKAAERFGRRQARRKAKRRQRNAFVQGAAIFYIGLGVALGTIMLGFLAHAVASLLDRFLGWAWAIGWNGWPF